MIKAAELKRKGDEVAREAEKLGVMDISRDEQIGVWAISQNPRTRLWEAKGPEGTYVRNTEAEIRAFVKLYPDGRT